jgi:hypothetical protein
VTGYRLPVDGAPLYHRPGIRVTFRTFSVGQTSYPIGELTNLRTARGPHDRMVRRAVGVSAVMVGAVGVLLGFTGGLHRLGAGAYLALGAAGVLPVLAALAGRRWRPPAYELWGRHEGADRLLFSSDEERQFGQVTRALLRAREAATAGGWREPIATTEPWRPYR